MKTHYVQDLEIVKDGEELELLCWVKRARVLKTVVFLDIVDSSGSSQAVVRKGSLPEQAYERMKAISPESAVRLVGSVGRHSGKNELIVTNAETIGEAKIRVSPPPREEFKIFESRIADHILKNRHFYLRNEKLMSVIKFKSNFMLEAHRWFNENGFVFLDAPVLTSLLLYDDESAFKINYGSQGNRNEKVFLSQCNTFQLEAAVHAFERVYNITPSFRAEHSRDDRHLREYWHLKAELAWVELDDLIEFASRMLYEISTRSFERSRKELKALAVDSSIDWLKPPFRNITYDQAIEELRSEGIQIEWGKSLGSREEEIITQRHGGRLLFIRGIPCKAEAFPFMKNAKNPLITETCDLIAPKGFGELLGTAMKITNRSDLLERMAEKGRSNHANLRRYGWYLDLRDYGCVPHGGVGMGIDRVVRYLLRLPHVRDAVSFPRLCDRIPNP